MKYSTIITRLEENLKEIDRLVKFDSKVLEFVNLKLMKLHEDACRRMDKNHEFPKRIQHSIDSIKDIWKHNSLKPYYDTIYNQCLVLLVSHFASSLHELFEESARCFIKEEISDSQLANIKYEFALKELFQLENCREEIGKIILDKDQHISFQDMQSTKRAFSKYFKIDFTEKTKEIENNIIVAQGCRHDVVHNGSKINERLLKQIRNANPRQFKNSLGVKNIGEKIEIIPEEIALVKENMLAFLNELAEQLRKKEAGLTPRA